METDPGLACTTKGRGENRWFRRKQEKAGEKGREAISNRNEEGTGPLLQVLHLTFSYPDGRKILDDISFTAERGQIIGITGPVACGKSTLGKAFLCEYPYEGQILYHGRELQDAAQAERIGWIGYLGHDPELFADSIAENVLLGEQWRIAVTYLQAGVVWIRRLAEMSEGVQTRVGSGGVRLSGGQAQRLALAQHPVSQKDAADSG